VNSEQSSTSPPPLLEALDVLLPDAAVPPVPVAVAPEALLEPPVAPEALLEATLPDVLPLAAPPPLPPPVATLHAGAAPMPSPSATHAKGVLGMERFRCLMKGYMAARASFYETKWPGRDAPARRQT
jgi:hypothetical protein